MSLFAGLLQDSKAPTCRNAGTAASASSLALPDTGFNLSLASTPHDGRHSVGSNVPARSSVPKTFCRGSTRALPNLGNKRGSSALPNAGASFLALNSESEANRTGSCSLLRLGPLEAPAAAPAYTAAADAAGHSNGSAAKALSFHQLQLSTAKQTRLSALPTGPASNSTSSLPTAGHSSRVWHLHQYSNETAVLDTAAALGELQRSDITRDSSTISLQHRSEAIFAAAVAVAASREQQAEASVGLQDCSAGMQHKAQQSKLQQQSRPPKPSKHMPSSVHVAPPPSAATAAAVASKLKARPPKEKGFQLTPSLFAAGTGSVAAGSKPVLAAASAAARARSCKDTVERLAEGCLLLPLPCSISSSSIACGGADMQPRGAAAGRSTAARAMECQQTEGRGAVGHNDEFKLDPSWTFKPQQGLLGQPQVSRKQQQAGSAADRGPRDPGGCTRAGDQQQNWQKLLQMQQSTDTQQQRKRHEPMLEDDNHILACADSETEKSDSLDCYQMVGGKQQDQRQQQQLANRGDLPPHQHAVQRCGRTRPRQQQQQCKNTSADNSEADSELEPASSNSPSAGSSSEWSGGSSGAAGDSSDGEPASSCSTEDGCRTARPSRRSTSTKRNARGGVAHGGSRTSVLQKRSASAPPAAHPADTVLQDVGNSKALQLQLPGLRSAAAVAKHAAGFPQQQQQQSKRAVTWSLLPLPGQQLKADPTPSPAAAAASDSNDRLCLEGQRRPGPPAAAAAVDVEGREALLHPKGHIRLTQPSAAALSRQTVLLIELPPCFDAAGDAGSIGRIVCSRQDWPNDAHQDLAAGSTVGGPVRGFDADPVRGLGLQTLLPQLGMTSSNNLNRAAANLAGPGLNCNPAKKGKKLNDSKRKVRQLLAGLLGDSMSDDDNSCVSDTESQGGSHSDRAESASLGHAGEDEESDEDGTGSDGDVVAADDREVTAVQLDLKGLLFSAVSLPLAGTAAVVRINTAGGNHAKASAQVEHLFNTSYIRAIPAADTDADDDPYAAGIFADDSDVEGQEGAAHFMVQDAYGLAAGSRDEDDGDIGQNCKGAGVGSRSRGGKCKRGGKSRRGGRLSTKSKATGNRRVGSRAHGTARGRGGSVRSSTGSKRGRGAAAGVVEAKPAAKKQKQLESWEVSDGDDE